MKGFKKNKSSVSVWEKKHSYQCVWMFLLNMFDSETCCVSTIPVCGDWALHGPELLRLLQSPNHPFIIYIAYPCPGQRRDYHS